MRALHCRDFAVFSAFLLVVHAAGGCSDDPAPSTRTDATVQDAAGDVAAAGDITPAADAGPDTTSKTDTTSAADTKTGVDTDALACAPGQACKSGRPCVADETCSAAGQCEGGVFTCGCIAPSLLYDDEQAKTKNDSAWWTTKSAAGEGIESFLCGDFVSQEDACLGRPYCDTETDPASWKCVTIPGTNKHEKGNECPATGQACVVLACDKDVKSATAGKCVLGNAGPTTPCDDGLACTEGDLCDGKGKCAAQKDNCACTPANAAEKCADLTKGDKCVPVYCDTTAGPNHACKLITAKGVQCYAGDDTPCAQNLCDSKTGKCALKPLNEGKPACDDGNPCTPNDGCFGGKCTQDPSKPKTNPCQCAKNADCAKFEDGDACNGTLYCDVAAKACEVNPATTVTCPTVHDGACIRNLCDPSTGACTLTPLENIATDLTTGSKRPMPQPVHDFVACDDGIACTANDRCKSGACLAGDVFLCQCTSHADCKKHEDGDVCNGTLYCDKSGGKGDCKLNPATVIACPFGGDNPCVSASCDKKTGECGLVPIAAIGTPCTDNNKCSVGDQCEGGSCISGTNVCQCQSDADCQGAGDLCSGTQFCDKSQNTCRKLPGSAVQCEEGNDTFCRKNVCSPKTGKCALIPVNDNVACATGDDCTLGACDLGGCEAFTSLCPCAADADCALFGGPCKASYGCKESVCAALQLPVACTPDGNPCTVTACAAKTGKCETSNAPKLKSCDDGDPCTADDKCDGQGKCAGGASTCTCGTDADCKVDATDKCLGTQVCDKSGPKAVCKAKPGSAADCDGKAGACSINACDPGSGKCLSDAQNCNDGDPCTIDSCDLGTDKCKHEAAPLGVACGEGAVCSAGQCKGAPLAGMLFVPGGKAPRGCNKEVETCSFQGESPQHQVDVSAFWLDRFEVTATAFKKCVDAGTCTKPNTGPLCTYDAEGLGGRPINCVTATQAEAYCGWLIKDGRLPTEAEWEKAARGGCELAKAGECLKSATVHVWGNSGPSCGVTLMDGTGKGGCSYSQVKVAGGGLKGAPGLPGSVAADKGPYGHQDLGGNVREWVADDYSGTAYADYDKAPVKDPKHKGNPGAKRVVRGGSWMDIAANPFVFRVAARQSFDPTTSVPTHGFRCAVTAK